MKPIAGLLYTCALIGLPLTVHLGHFWETTNIYTTIAGGEGHREDEQEKHSHPGGDAVLLLTQLDMGTGVAFRHVQHAWDCRCTCASEHLNAAGRVRGAARGQRASGPHGRCPPSAVGLGRATHAIGRVLAALANDMVGRRGWRRPECFRWYTMYCVIDGIRDRSVKTTAALRLAC